MGTVRVAVDAMSGDRGLPEVAAGAALILSERDDVECVLVGDADAVHAHGIASDPRVSVVGSTEVIGSSDDVTRAIREKRGSSLHATLGLVRDGAVDAAVTAAPTGAVVLLGAAIVRRQRGVTHPCLASVLPVPGGAGQVLVDSGATVDRSPAALVQFATLGRQFARDALGVATPRVGLLANGTEATKGDDVHREADRMLREIDGYVGYVEPYALLSSLVDVIVTDGLTGNLVVKTMEASIRVTVYQFRAVMEASESATRAVAEERFERSLDWLRDSGFGGGPLLGVNGVVVKVHGAAEAIGIARSIESAIAGVRRQPLAV